MNLRLYTTWTYEFKNIYCMDLRIQEYIPHGLTNLRIYTIWTYEIKNIYYMDL